MQIALELSALSTVGMLTRDKFGLNPFACAFVPQLSECVSLGDEVPTARHAFDSVHAVE